MSDTDQKPDVILPGYELIKKIGSGGYGEVWSAIAPGGIHKAVKYVYGNEFDKQATSELHALEKIKSVRHPFLLSLDRIEIIDGRLIVVSELADGSLRDRFRDCVVQGLPGIPREELLGYLSDAADALDFISSKHDLAHLDIKPENLLLVAGHVKVADFGLVKSLNNQTQASLVGGMTPTYAAPEVFRGTPSRESDQYSLAILYQEMLTGTVPFDGVNAAELTLQHMQSDPDLVHLANGDRFVIARALSKDSSHRYESSAALVAAIKQSASVDTGFQSSPQPTKQAAAPARVVSAESKLRRHSATEVFEGSAAITAAAASTTSLSPEPLEKPTPEEHAAPDISAEAFAATPAVFIGIGGAGARVLRALRSQINEHLGATNALPAAPMLLFDTDPQTLASATRGNESGRGLAASETVALPLRRPQEYREKADLLLRWLGRRWLYNIPRSLRTEGIRPLGRLALVDHARQAFQRLRGTISSAVAEESRASTAEAVGLLFNTPGLRVYVIASPSGAAGSGMSLDVAYAARSIAQRLGIENAKFIGVMTHSTPRDATRRELARVNAYAWLSEFQNFRSSTAGYPGDSGVGLPAHEPGVAAFDHSYFVPLGDQIDTPTLESGANAVAEYLFADAFTAGQHQIDACRASATDEATTIRSFAVTHRDGQDDETLCPAERLAAVRMIDRWIGEAPGPDTSVPAGLNSTDQVVHGSVAFLGKTQLDPSTLASNCRSLLEASLGGDATAYVEARFEDTGSQRIGEMAAAIDRCFGIRTSDAKPQEIDGKSIDSIVEPIVTKLVQEARTWVLGRVNSTSERLEGAEQAASWLRDYLTAIDADLVKVAANIDGEWSRRLNESQELIDRPDECRFKLFRLRLDQAALIASQRIITSLVNSTENLPVEVATLRTTLQEVRAAFTNDAKHDVPEREVAKLSIALEERLQSDYLAPQAGLLAALTKEQPVENLSRTIAHAARVISRETSDGNRAAADAALVAGFSEPPIVECGGAYCHLTLELPSATSSTDDGTGEDELLLVTEMSGVSLPHLGADLIGGRADYASFAERVRTRRDLPWIDAVTGDSRQKVEVASSFESASFDHVPTAVVS
ncbi:MAG: tubulin-like doman-containing protein [Planctomycetota bacterium]